MIRILVLIVLFSISIELHASTTQNSTSVVIESYRIQANGNRFAVGLPNNSLSENPANCSSSAANRAFYVVRPTNEDPASVAAYDQMFASVVAAKFNGAPIRVWISNDLCSSNLPIVELIRVE